MSRSRSTIKDKTASSASIESCRLDLWLYRTRLLKTRTLAARMVSSGKVRLTRNGHTERTQKSHTLIRPGDSVTFMRGPELFSVRMMAPGTRRGPAPEAQSLYERLE